MPTAPTHAHPTPTPSASPAWRFAPHALAIFLLTLVVFSPALRNAWTGWDDTAYVLNNPLMHAPDGLARIWTTRDSEQFYPLTFSSYYLQHALFGPRPGGYHAVNILLHAVNAVLCLALARALGLSRLAALLAAGLFALHPTQVMSVAWIAEHKNTLCGVFTLLCLLCWVHAARRDHPALWYLASLAAFVLAMLAKTAVVALPISLLLLDTLILRPRSEHPGALTRALLRIAPMLLIATALALITYLFEQKFVDRHSPDWIPTFAERLQIAGAAPWVYLWHLVWPFHLSPAYSTWNVGASRLTWYLPLLASILAGLALLAAWWRTRRAPPRTSAWALWGASHFLLMLGPTLGLIPFGNLAVTPVSDHFLYLASLGLFLPLARLADHLPAPRRPLVGVLATLALLACAVLSFRDVPVYRDATSMWSRAVSVAPRNYTARLGLAEGLAKSGRLDDALPHYQAAVDLRPRWPDGWLFLGATLRARGDLDGAARAYRTALDLAPGNTDAMIGLAGVLELQGEIPQALALFEQGVARAPTNLDGRLGLAKMYLGFARFPDALAQFEAARALRPDLPTPHLGVATCLRALGRDADALAALRAALADHPADLSLLNMLARLRATSRDDTVRDGPEAVALASRTLELAGAPNPFLLDTLAAALAAAGRADDAARAALDAATLHDRAGAARAAAASRDLAARYARGENLRE